MIELGRVRTKEKKGTIVSTFFSPTELFTKTRDEPLGQLPIRLNFIVSLARPHLSDPEPWRCQSAMAGGLVRGWEGRVSYPPVRLSVPAR